MKRVLRGQVAIVTGASSGIGWQSAIRLSEQGVRVCVTARRQDALDTLAAEIREKGGECLPVAADVTRDDDVRQVVERCLGQYGRVDILVNNAGVQLYAPFEKYTIEEVRRILEVTFFGYLRFAWAVLPHFRRQGRGHVLNVLSMLSVGAAPLLSGYTAAKHALLGWSDSLRLELYGTGIDVSGILMPSVSTPMFDHAPTRLGLSPRPVPPTYPTDLAARAVVKVARRPNPRYVPTILQGKLPILLQDVAPWVGDAILGRFGARMQLGKDPIDRPDGNLWGPIPEGVGPEGSVPPTPKWKLWGGTGLAALLALSTMGGAIFGARAGVRAIRGTA